MSINIDAVQLAAMVAALQAAHDYFTVNSEDVGASESAVWSLVERAIPDYCLPSQ